MSDHLFALNFDVIYAAFYDMFSIICGKNIDTEAVFSPLKKIEDVIFAYIGKYLPNVEKCIIDIRNVYPCRFVCNGMGLNTCINEDGINTVNS